MTAEDLTKTVSDKFKNIDLKTISAKDIGTDPTFKRKIVWFNAIGFLFMHILGIIGAIYLITGRVKLITIVWTYFIIFLSTEGVTIGAHRLYSHRAFKAKPILRVILITLFTLAGQNCLYIWVRDHRLHHRYSDTDADPHNSNRGFFFSHIGWLMFRKHPLVKELGKNIDLSDLEADWMVMFQKKYYKSLYFLMAIFIPIWVPMRYFGESWDTAILFVYFTRYIIILNGTWLVNSAAHIYGTRPYDKTLQPVENWNVSFLTLGEGWHNYHHAFPWDYKAAELSMHFNLSAQVIRFMAKIGWAYDLKEPTEEQVRNRIKRVGDGTHYELGNDEDRAAVTAAIGIVHPLNLTYTTTQKPPKTILKSSGMPLFSENDVFGNLEIDVRKRNIAW